MGKNSNSNPWYKKWWIWAIAIIAIGVVGYVLEPNPAQQADTAISRNPPVTKPKEWTRVSALTGDTKQKSGDVFSTSGGNLRIKYTVNAMQDSGTALLYLLPEGSTTTKNSKGDMDVAVQDITTIGTKTDERIIQKPAGNYYLYINTSSIKDYSIAVEEQK